MNKKVIGLAILIAAFCAGVAAAYNGLIWSAESVNNAWAQVQNVYQRRLDLVPNLVETVKGYAEHEKSTFMAVTEARSNASKIAQHITPEVLNDPANFKKFQEAQESMGAALGRLLLIVERYPELKANENFLALQSQLEGTENRIAVERRRFNDTVRVYNVKIKQFPTNILAAVFNFKEKVYFEAQEGAGAAPVVKF